MIRGRLGKGIGTHCADGHFVDFDVCDRKASVSYNGERWVSILIDDYVP